MPPVPAEAFASEFRGLSTEERVEFVAGLWAARGWETAVDGAVVAAERGDEDRRIRIADPGWFGTPDVSGVDTLAVARDRTTVREAAEEAGVDYHTPADLHDLLLYGIDRETAAALYADRFDRPLERSVPDESDDDGRAATLLTALPSLRENRRAFVAILLVALVGVAVAGPALSGGNAPDRSPVTVNGVTPGDESAGAIGAASPTPTEMPGLIPGVTRAGVVDPRELTQAHVDGVRNRSRVQQRELQISVNGSGEIGLVSRNRTAWVANASHYRSESSRTFVGDSGPSQMAGGVYAAGGDAYQRTVFPDGVRYSRYPPSEYPATEIDADVQASLYRYFAGADDVVVKCAIEFDTDCPTYRIEVDDPPAALGSEVEAYEALAIVSNRGVITTIRANYTVPDRDGDGERERVRFALDYQFEEVTVSPPAWLPEAKNATANGTATEGGATPTATETG